MNLSSPSNANNNSNANSSNNTNNNSSNGVQDGFSFSQAQPSSINSPFTRSPTAISQIRSSWVHESVEKRWEEFTSLSGCSLFVGTWNVNGRKIDGVGNSGVSEWLFPGGAEGGSCDVYAVGFQEIVDLTAVNCAVDTKSHQRSKEWTSLILQSLNSACPYTLVSSHHLVGVLLCVFVRSEKIANVGDVFAERVASGVMGVMGNKGGVAVRMQYYDSRLAFYFTIALWYCRCHMHCCMLLLSLLL